MLFGAGGVVALIGAGGAWRVTRMPVSAVKPWSFDPAPLADIRLEAFRYAILAPNPHNRQPWLIRMEGKDVAILYCDLAKRLPQTDPFDRQITIGFGTFIELARIAAAERGYRMDIEPFPEGEPQPRLDRRPLARLRFVDDPQVQRDPLFASITARRTNRLVYTAAPSKQIKHLQSADHFVSADKLVAARVAKITVAAMTDETTTHRTHMESVRLLRIGHSEIDATPDGLALSGPMIETTGALGMTTRESIADPNSSAFQIGLDGLRESCGSVPAALWITSPSNSRADQISAGRRYANAQLRATKLGLAMHPMSQSLQEYPEMATHYAAIHSLLGVTGGARIQMLARVGLAPDIAPSPRWPMEKHLQA
jgi:hypothetical protein